MVRGSVFGSSSKSNGLASVFSRQSEGMFDGQGGKGGGNGQPVLSRYS